MKDGAVVQIGTSEEILTSPADDYVARFVEDVDRTKVLVAEDIMKSPKPLLAPKDGPRMALRIMKENGLSSIFVVGRDNNLKGLVLAEDALKAIESGEKTLDNLILSNVPKVNPSTTITELLPLVAESKLPLAVVNDTNILIGIIVKGSVLAGLAGQLGKGESAVD